MLVIIGKSGTGKSSIVNKLVNEFGYEKIITYTSRPIRLGEVDGQDYHFISKEVFLDKIHKEEFMEYKVYNTVDGVWYYGSAKEDFINASERSVIILTPAGYMDFINNLHVNHTAILIKSNWFITRMRLLKRGDKKSEIKRRMYRDWVDFKDIDCSIDFILKNNGNSLNSLEAITDKVYRLHRINSHNFQGD